MKTYPVRSVMPSYNEIDGIPSHANGWLLNKVLRGEWGYQGAVVSDYYGIRELMTRHKMFGNIKDAAERAIKSGVDVETPDPEGYVYLPELVREGRVPQKLVDQAVRRVLALKFEAGLFENPYPDVASAEAKTATPDAIALAREAADKAIVLLKNDKQLLPLDPSKIRRMAVIGTHARDTPIGGYSDVPKHVVSVLEGMQEAGKGRFAVDYSEGVRLTESRCWSCDEVKLVPASVNRKLIAAAVQTARKADVIVHGPGRQRADQPRGLGRQSPRRPLLARPGRPAGGPRAGDPGAAQADRGGAAQRPAAIGELPRAERARAPRRLVPRPGDRARRRRRVVRQGQSRAGSCR